MTLRRIDIRAHAGASSSRKDDDTYQNQAAAYLAFQGVRAHATEDSARQLQGHDGCDNDVQHQKTLVELDPNIFVDDTQLAYAALDSQLHTSSLVVPDNELSGLKNVDFPRRATQRALERAVSVTRNLGSDSGPGFHCSIHDFAGRKRRLSEVQGINEDDNTSNRIAQRSASFQLGKQSEALDQVSESSYLKSPVLDRSNKKRRLDAPHPSTDSPDGALAARYIPLPDGNQVGIAYVGDCPVPSTETPVNPDSLDIGRLSAGNETTSELPTSYSLSDITSESYRSKRKLSTSQRSVSDPGPHGGSTSPAVLRTPARADQGNIPSKRPNGTRLHNSTASSELQASRTRRNIGPNNHPKSAIEQAITAPDPNTTADKDKDKLAKDKITLGDQGSALQSQLQSLPNSIHPPEPSVSVQSCSTHITDHLRFLAEESVASNSYRPVSTEREPRPLERGHWLLDCSPWPLQLQIEFWQFLQKMIENGTAGWGVWCTQESSENHSVESAPYSLGKVKVYCWGEVVRHIYLLLYVASKSKVRKAGLQWIDSEDKAVVQMRSS